MTSINIKLIGLTRPGVELVRLGFPDLPNWEMDAVLIQYSSLSTIICSNNYYQSYTPLGVTPVAPFGFPDILKWETGTDLPLYVRTTITCYTHHSLQHLQLRSDSPISQNGRQALIYHCMSEQLLPVIHTTRCSTSSPVQIPRYPKMGDGH